MQGFQQNKYTRWYYVIIDKRRSTVPKGYVEKHHVVPRSMGGSNEASNVVKLTAQEHFVCHMLLVKMTIGSDHAKMVHAAWMLANDVRGGRIVSSRVYAFLKAQKSQVAKGRLLVKRRDATAQRDRPIIDAFKSGITRREIAERLSVSRSAVEKALRRAKRWNDPTLDVGPEHRYIHVGISLQQLGHERNERLVSMFIDDLNENMSYVDIAQKHDMSPTTVRTSIQKHRKYLTSNSLPIPYAFRDKNQETRTLASKRRDKVDALLNVGFSLKRIAEELGLKYHTVKHDAAYIRVQRHGVQIQKRR